jgi:hypothetical protein
MHGHTGEQAGPPPLRACSLARAGMRPLRVESAALSPGEPAEVAMLRLGAAAAHTGFIF